MQDEIIDAVIPKGVGGPWEKIIGKYNPTDRRHVEKVSKVDLEFNRNESVDRAFEYLTKGSTIDNSTGGIHTAIQGWRGISIYFGVGSVGLGAGLMLGKLIFGC